MARRRLQLKGNLYQQGGWWKLRWRIDVVKPDGQCARAWSRPVDIGAAARIMGLRPMSKREAERQAWERYLSKLDQNNRVPQSMMTLEEFVERNFTPGHVALLKPAGRNHYTAMLKHILPGLGKMRLCDVRKEHVQQLVSGILSRGYIRERKVRTADGKLQMRQETHPYSVQMAKHIKTAVSAIFTFAESEDSFSGTNPARHVRLPEMVRRARHALTIGQVRELVAALPAPASDMVLFAIMTSMNIAEILGLRWGRVNLSGDWATVDGEALPPFHLAVREQWYRGQAGTVKAPSRRRNIPISAPVREILTRLRARPDFLGAEDFVFACSTGKPLDEHNICARVLKPIGRKLGMPWISWHCFRHTHATLTKSVGLADFDRQILMGHASLEMTDRYTHGDVERRREALEAIGRLLTMPEVPIQ